jgi:hypothetical protein
LAARLALAAALALIAFSPAAPLTPSAEAGGWRYLPPPAGDYSPKHVWQLKDNCIWAAGSMLLDKWSHGRVRASQWALRHASGDKKGGSSLRDLARGFARAVGVRLAIPGFGASMKWWQLLDRLESGGGAVIVGEYSRMPAHFSRWSPSFARKRNSSHAVFVENYDRRHGRVWLDDPLAPGGWPGEWIPVDDLRRFADIDGGVVQAAATPARRRPSTQPLIDQAYRLGPPKAAAKVILGQTLAVSIPLRITDGFPRPATQRLEATWQPADHPDASRPATTRSRTVKPSRSGFSTRLPVPAEPGRYVVDLRLAPATGRGPARAVGKIEVRVAGPYSALVGVTTESSQDVGYPVPLTIVVENTGLVDWRATPVTSDVPASMPVAQTSAVLTLVWRSAVRPDEVALSVPVGLGPGERRKLQLVAAAPPAPGVWRLEATVGHPILGPMPDPNEAMRPFPIEFVTDRTSAAD